MTNTKLLAILVAFCLLDIIIPIPILGILLIYIVYDRPAWFMDMVQEIYQGK
jgi:hypothetical protein